MSGFAIGYENIFRLNVKWFCICQYLYLRAELYSKIVNWAELIHIGTPKILVFQKNVKTFNIDVSKGRTS